MTTDKRIIFVGTYEQLFDALQAVREHEEVFAEPPQPDPELPKVKDAVDMLYGQCRLTGRRGRPLPRLVSAVKPKKQAE